MCRESNGLSQRNFKIKVLKGGLWSQYYGKRLVQFNCLFENIERLMVDVKGFLYIFAYISMTINM